MLTRLRETLLAASSIVPHTDADGLSAGALALRARNEGADAAVLFTRHGSPWRSPDALPPGRPALLDWGVREFPRPALMIDHHVPETDDPGDDITVFTEQETSTSALVRRLLPEQPAWLAAVGAVGDLGDAGFTLPEAHPAPKTAVRRLVSLVNAPRRLPDGPVRTALALLVEHDDPKAALADPRIAELEDAKREWRAGLDAVVRTAPRVAPDAALIRFASPYQVHPLVATTWARRLAPRMVIAANDDYLPGRVNFAVRGGGKTDDLRARLRAALPDATGDVGNGHARATGGSLPPDEFERMIRALGFGQASE
jgi:single-stranded-DNA-specific exonuclease